MLSTQDKGTRANLKNNSEVSVSLCVSFSGLFAKGMLHNMQCAKPRVTVCSDEVLLSNFVSARAALCRSPQKLTAAYGSARALHCATATVPCGIQAAFEALATGLITSECRLGLVIGNPFEDERIGTPQIYNIYEYYT